MHYAPDAVISFCQTFWPLFNSLAVAHLFYGAIAPPCSSWHNPITNRLLSFRGFSPLARLTPWIIMLHCPIILALTINRTIPRLSPGLDAPSLRSVAAYCALVLTLTLPLAHLASTRVEPAWQRMSSRLLDAALGLARKRRSHVLVALL